jgi:hypothetical protein
MEIIEIKNSPVSGDSIIDIKIILNGNTYSGLLIKESYEVKDEFENK